MHVCMDVGEERVCVHLHTHIHIYKNRTDIHNYKLYLQYFQELSKFFKTK